VQAPTKYETVLNIKTAKAAGGRRADRTPLGLAGWTLGLEVPPSVFALMASPKPGDMALVTKLDRLGRSTRELLDLIELVGPPALDAPRAHRRGPQACHGEWCEVRSEAEAVGVPAQGSACWRDPGLSIAKSYAVDVSVISRL